MDRNLDAFLEAWPSFQEGILITIYLTLGGAALAFVMALVLGVAAGSRPVFFRGIARVIIEFFRGTSLLVQLFWLPLLGYELDPLFCGILALGLNYGAYAAEVVRGSLAAVPSEQSEAAIALNFTRWQRLRKVTFPQAWVQMIPPLNNLLIQLLKGSALASFILLHDLTFQIGELRKTTGDTLFAFGIGLILYFVIAYVLTLFMNLLEFIAKARLGVGPSLGGMFSLRPERIDDAVGVDR